MAADDLLLLGFGGGRASVSMTWIRRTTRNVPPSIPLPVVAVDPDVALEVQRAAEVERALLEAERAAAPVPRRSQRGSGQAGARSASSDWISTAQVAAAQCGVQRVAFERRERLERRAEPEADRDRSRWARMSRSASWVQLAQARGSCRSVVGREQRVRAAAA